MSDEAVGRLTGEQMLALKFAGHRQLARWSGKATLSSHQQARRLALSSAVRILQDKAFANGCELRSPSSEGPS
jgi:hypothetical protein